MLPLSTFQPPVTLSEPKECQPLNVDPSNKGVQLASVEPVEAAVSVVAVVSEDELVVDEELQAAKTTAAKIIIRIFFICLFICF